MAIDNITSATQTNLSDAPSGTNPNGILGKDDFLKLLLIELKYQDPTEPMDSEKILSQTSQLATLEASENTNKALEELAASLTSSRDFSTIAAIGKIADTGSNAIVYETGSQPAFELYFPNDIQSGTIDVLDANGNVIASMPIESGEKGIHSFEWDGKDMAGNSVDEGMYYITANYNDASGASHETRVGLYPIESVRFDGDETLVKIGSSYIPFGDIKEVTQG
ncbi:MAG: flagellar hook capping FlgD N-terminal domain-containing protein [Campylobacterota bacterium]|nr:flagellar hook capping FlgD N-terminal domain-containing protein [Campylobacterota bacterium]